ncbi:hypothetical protein ASZ90_014601 [hydrocarbon metagenome]|uniref:Uncharacterized protein n=1 Tax=hydrocarbon metagenome TaxID=938273 RepID=A0A0W8F4A1_9ZZZZ
MEDEHNWEGAWQDFSIDNDGQAPEYMRSVILPFNRNFLPF